MTAHPLVSVCIANYNGMEIIDDCLRSVLEQEGNIPVEILVHDDASSDGSSAYIRNHYPDVTLIESPANVGFCVANNRMVAAARGKYLLLLNNDAALYTDALKALRAEAERLNQPAILGLPQYDAASGDLVDIGSLFDPFFNPVPNQNRSRNDVGMVIGACLWIPKGLWEEMGGFPEWFDSIAEDMYLCCRARLAGYSVRALSVSGYRHWQGKSFGGGKITTEGHLVTTRKRRTLSERNKSYVMLLTYSTPWLLLIFPMHLSLLMLEGLALAVAKCDSSLFRDIYLNCLKTLWQERKRLFLLRQKIQAQNKIGLRRFWSVFQLAPHKLRLLLRHGLPQLK
jgi:GT2 family glycosyltransferase